MPATEPSGISTPLYEVMHQTFAHTSPTALPSFSAKTESRVHGNDERISLESLTSGVRLLKEIVLAVQ